MHAVLMQKKRAAHTGDSPSIKVIRFFFSPSLLLSSMLTLTRYKYFFYCTFLTCHLTISICYRYIFANYIIHVYWDISSNVNSQCVLIVALWWLDGIFLSYNGHACTFDIKLITFMLNFFFLRVSILFPRVIRFPFISAVSNPKVY